jgi:Ca2+-binding EF-hand superfamily protein
MRQIIQLLDTNKTGVIKRKDLADRLRGLCESVPLDSTRALATYFDERGTGNISVAEICQAIGDQINQLLGGGVFAFMQVRPIIARII